MDELQPAGKDYNYTEGERSGCLGEGRVRMKSGELLLAGAIAALLVSGCGMGSGPQYPHAKLEGAVTLDGTPVDTGRVNFMPAPGVQGQPVSADIAAGRYSAPDVPLGSVTVTFSMTKETGQMITEGDREPYPEIVSIVPPHYAQGISVNVTGDNAAQDFALTTSEASP